MKTRTAKRKKKDPYASQRRSWGNVNPVTKVHADKTKYQRKKRIGSDELQD